ncbi:unnamed protein product [Rotaria sp. Silwood1]|nr:unnamed protein product [Rotaria sp. Silwood1]
MEVLYSLIGVHIRLDKIASDSFFTEHLTFMTRSWNGVINSLGNSILNRFCSEILLRIHCKIKWLTLEPLCMEHVSIRLGKIASNPLFTEHLTLMTRSSTGLIN